MCKRERHIYKIYLYTKALICVKQNLKIKQSWTENKKNPAIVITVCFYRNYLLRQPYCSLVGKCFRNCLITRVILGTTLLSPSAGILPEKDI